MVLTGAGGAFCSGADLSDPDGPATDPTRSGLARMRRLGDVALALHRVTKPTIAKVDGVAVGAGLSLALGCDLVVCSDRARLSMIFAKRGLSLDNGASWLLPRLVGLARAKEIALFGGMWSGEEAAAIGLVNRALPARRARPVRRRTGPATLAAGPPLALSMTKTLLHASSMSSMEQAVEDEARCQALNFSTAGHGGGHGGVRREARAGLRGPLNRAWRVWPCSAASKAWSVRPHLSPGRSAEPTTPAGSGPGARSGRLSPSTPTRSSPSGPTSSSPVSSGDCSSVYAIEE